MFAAPADTPVTNPVVEPIVAIAEGLMVHVPPVAASDSVVVAPTHTPVAPVIGDMGLTLNVLVTWHPPIAYVTKPVPPLIPVTTPVDVPMVIVVAVLLQIPPVTASVSVIVAPVQTVEGPPMAVGVAFTVIDFTAVQPVVPIV